MENMVTLQPLPPSPNYSLPLTTLSLPQLLPSHYPLPPSTTPLSLPSPSPNYSLPLTTLSLPQLLPPSHYPLPPSTTPSLSLPSPSLNYSLPSFM